MDQLAQCRNELLSLHLNFERLQLVIYAKAFRNKMMEIVSLVQQVEGMTELNQGEFSTTVPTNNNDRTEGIAALNTDINDESILLVEHNETTASVTEKRFMTDKNKLEHLLSLGFTVRKIARDGLLGSNSITIHCTISWKEIK